MIALLGLASDGDGRRFPIYPDYKKPVVEFYRDVTGFLRDGHSLQMLSLVEDHSDRQIEGLPSWVPDYSVTAHESVGSFKQFNKMAYAAAGNTPIAVIWSLGSKSLHVHAYATDEVQIVSLNAFEKVQPVTMDILARWFSMAATHSSPFDLSRMLQWLSILENPQGRSDKGLDTFWRTMIGDAGYSANPAPQESFRTFQAFMVLAMRAHAMAQVDSSNDSAHTVQRPVQVVQDLTAQANEGDTHESIKGDVRELMNCWTRNSADRRFFFTKKDAWGRD
ncbi:MAG: hypothetical protein M1830_009331 [Pleopsidium flavum]|nr:MAG: hypothetical protein M1830_009331 [Pleopsidium flavum]